MHWRAIHIFLLHLLTSFYRASSDGTHLCLGLSEWVRIPVAQVNTLNYSLVFVEDVRGGL